MTTSTLSTAPAVANHNSLAQLRAGLAPHVVWFHAPSTSDAGWWSDLGADLRSRVTVHRCGPVAALTVDSLAAEDLASLRGVCGAVFLSQPLAAVWAFGDGSLSEVFSANGWRCFVSHHQSQASRLCSAIGSLEFLASSAERLTRYPGFGHGRVLRDMAARTDRQLSAVFVLDLVQDFEILQPLMALAAQPFGPFRASVAITERVLASHIWPGLERFLAVLNVPWFKPLGPSDVAAALGNDRALLVTAAESSAPGHVFAHECCRSAPARTLTVTFQHGHECVGLRHHRSHDLKFPQGVRFGSDLIFAWRHADELPDLHPADKGRCIAVGVTKRIASRAAALLEARWSGQQPVAARPLVSQDALVLAENLHSARFLSPQRYQRYLQFIQRLHEQSSLRLVIRSHPGKRTLEKSKADEAYDFLAGELEAEHLLVSRGLVGAASTILIDAALCARPTAVWTDTAELGDAANYAGLPVVTDAQDLPAALLEDPELLGLAAFAWAVDSTAALNGHPVAWQKLCSLMN